MQRLRRVIPLLAALVLCLGMMGVAAADHPACQNENPPPGCEDDGHPDATDDMKDDEDENEDDEDENGEDDNPLQPLADVCHQVVDALRENVDPQFEGARALCDALGEQSEGGGDEESPTQPIADGCMEAVNGLVEGGVPADDGEQLCAQFGDTGDGGTEEPCEPDCEAEESPTQPIADGCMEVVNGLVEGGVPADDGEQLCAQFGDTGDGGTEEPCEPDCEEEPSPLAPVADGCNSLVDALVENDPTGQAGALSEVCDQM